MFGSQAMPVSVLLCLGFLLCLLGTSTVNCAAFFSPGECPDGHKPGDSWPYGCGRCDCDKDGYACYTCGVYSLSIDETSCYTYKETEKEYPDCCTPKTKCRGEEGFKEELLIG